MKLLLPKGKHQALSSNRRSSRSTDQVSGFKDRCRPGEFRRMTFTGRRARPEIRLVFELTPGKLSLSEGSAERARPCYGIGGAELWGTSRFENSRNVEPKG